jgi:hypothetical protein
MRVLCKENITLDAVGVPFVVFNEGHLYDVIDGKLMHGDCEACISTECDMFKKHFEVLHETPIIKKEEFTNTDEYYFKEKVNKITELLLAKNKDYGNSFDGTRKEYGSMAFEIKLTEKLSRYKQLARNNNEVKSESILDTLNDIIGYCLLELRYRDKND